MPLFRFQRVEGSLVPNSDYSERRTARPRSLRRQDGHAVTKFTLARVLTAKNYQIEQMVLERAIPYDRLRRDCDELLVALLLREKYDLSRLDERGRIVFSSKSRNVIFHVDVLCLEVLGG